MNTITCFIFTALLLAPLAALTTAAVGEVVRLPDIPIIRSPPYPASVELPAPNTRTLPPPPRLTHETMSLQCLEVCAAEFSNDWKF